MKYFYTDPLAAAWMAKHFGMKFEAPYDCDFDISVLEVQSRRGEKIKFHVDTASQELLETKIGDIVSHNGGRIIQRNCTPFMWPEVNELI